MFAFIISAIVLILTIGNINSYFLPFENNQDCIPHTRWYPYFVYVPSEQKCNATPVPPCNCDKPNVPINEINQNNDDEDSSKGLLEDTICKLFPVTPWSVFEVNNTVTIRVTTTRFQDPETAADHNCTHKPKYEKLFVKLCHRSKCMDIARSDYY